MSVRYVTTDQISAQVAEQVAELNDLVFDEGWGKDFADDLLNDLSYRDGFRMTLAYDGERLVGMGVGYQSNETEFCWLHTMVLSEYRGQKVGGRIHDIMCDVPFSVWVITPSESALRMMEARAPWECLAQRVMPDGQVLKFMYWERGDVGTQIPDA